MQQTRSPRKDPSLDPHPKVQVCLEKLTVPQEATRSLVVLLRVCRSAQRPVGTRASGRLQEQEKELVQCVWKRRNQCVWHALGTRTPGAVLGAEISGGARGGLLLMVTARCRGEQSGRRSRRESEPWRATARTKCLGTGPGGES